ncbi:hypothetical protein PAECIP111893_00173 [Paenibacillus plantiphilus]|uniref:Small, acid-soluble spore protein, alpha/beta type n=1 Tax=Paenibacillus plantiphilus TaxID=2905650 RepID=A0ABM9BLG1_9BACL|nr:hypothetical protein [Paenibacillus plantiphilus]CAH1190096.1 hypothetical protein PAECIP111893_00173 [Paenibacillus plantiphilus]
MNTQVKIPHGDEKVTVELTRKEMMALAGIRFHGNHNIEVSARKKLNEMLEGKSDSSNGQGIPRQLLN